MIEFVGPTRFGLSFAAVDSRPFLPPDEPDTRRIVLYDGTGQILGSVRDLIGEKWNAQQIPQEPGDYHGILLAPEPLKFKVRGEFQEANVVAHVTVESRLHLGQWPISRVSGFLEESSGAIVTRDLQFSSLSMVEVEKSWPRIRSLEDLAVRPAMVLKALDRPCPDDEI